MRTLRKACVAVIMALGCAAAHAQSAEDQLAQVIAALMQPAGTEGSYADWNSLDAVKQIRWQSGPPTMLDDALPDGSYFTLKGLANLGGRPFGVVATGARTMVVNVYFRNVGKSPVGEPAVVGALQRQGFSLDLARCPIKGAAGAGNKWWRVQGPNKRPALFQFPDGLQRHEVRGVRAAARRNAAHHDAAAAAPLHGPLLGRRGWTGRVGAHSMGRATGLAVHDADTARAFRCQCRGPRSTRHRS